MCLVAPGSLEPATLLTVDLTSLGGLDAPFEDGLAVRFHTGTADVPAKLHLLAEGDAAPGPMPQGSRAVVQLSCREPVAVRRGDRFVLRRPSPQETIGGGRVLDTARPRVRRRAPLRAASVAVLRGDDEHAVAALFLSEAGPAGLEVQALAQRLGIHVEAAAAHVDALAAAGSAMRLSPTLAVAASASVEMITRADAFFAERRKAGVPTLFVGRRELLGKIARELPEATGEAWLAMLAAAKRLVVSGDQAGPAGSAASGGGRRGGGLRAADRRGVARGGVRGAPEPRPGQGARDEAAGRRRPRPASAQDRGARPPFPRDHRPRGGSRGGGREGRRRGRARR